MNIEELVTNSYYFSRKRILKDLNNLNDAGFSNKVICQILEINPAVLKYFLDGGKLNKKNYLKLKEGLAEIKKQHDED